MPTNVATAGHDGGEGGGNPFFLKLKLWIPMQRLDRYLLGEIGAPFLGGVVFFTFVFLMFQVLRLADFFIVHNVPGRLILKIMALMTISFLPFVLPIAFLISALTAFGRLSADSELIAMKSSGFSMTRLFYPILWVAGLVSLLTLILNLEWVPWSERTFKATLVKVSNTKAISSVQEGTFTSGFFDLLVFAEKVEPSTGKLNNVFIYDDRETNSPVVVIAKEGKIQPVRTDSDLSSAILLQLQEGNIHRNDIEKESYRKINYGKYGLYLKIDEGGESAVAKRKTYSFSQLLTQVKTAQKGTEDYYGLSTELWRRFALALSPFGFGLLGIGLGTIRTRFTHSSAAMTTFAIVFIYYIILVACLEMSWRGWSPAFVNLQIPNVIVLIAAIYSFRKASW